MCLVTFGAFMRSLSARRAWIEILVGDCNEAPVVSLSARRAWIEIGSISQVVQGFFVALRKESVDRNVFLTLTVRNVPSRSPQGERG